jgi:glyoxylase-like metal-dependent hydrolase (beta-lactamase superfamily II)
MVMLFDRAHGVLLSADALWENGFGLIFPEIAGEPGFDDMHAVLDLIATLPVQVVVPGHGSCVHRRGRQRCSVPSSGCRAFAPTPRAAMPGTR